MITNDSKILLKSAKKGDNKQLNEEKTGQRGRWQKSTANKMIKIQQTDGEKKRHKEHSKIGDKETATKKRQKSVNKEQKPLRKATKRQANRLKKGHKILLQRAKKDRPKRTTKEW